MKIILTALLVVMVVGARAQNNAIFSGGTADGWHRADFAQAGNAIFTGSGGNGWSSQAFSQAVSNLFAGGAGDGWANHSFAQTGNLIFTGGNGDGWTFISFAQAGNNIFGGGQGDGWASTFRPMGVLPVRLITFTAQKQGAAAWLGWQTAGEKDAAYFVVERSDDGRRFEKVGQVRAAGTTAASAGQQYSFLDAGPLPGPNYYRLKQVDTNGQFLYSDIRVVVFEKQPAPVKVYPVPARAWLTVEIPGALQQQAVELVWSNAAGVSLGQARLAKGGTVQVISVQHLPAGVYHLQLRANGYQSTVTFIKQ